MCEEVFQMQSTGESSSPTEDSSSSMEESSSYMEDTADSMRSMSETFLRQILGRWSDEDKSRLFQLIKQKLGETDCDFARPVSYPDSVWRSITSELNTNREIHYTIEEVLEMTMAMKESIAFADIAWNGVCQRDLRLLFLAPELPRSHLTSSQTSGSSHNERVASCSANHESLWCEVYAPSDTALMYDVSCCLAQMFEESKISAWEVVTAIELISENSECLCEGDAPSHTRLVDDASIVLAGMFEKSKISATQRIAAAKLIQKHYALARMLMRFGKDETRAQFVHALVG